MAKKTGGGFLGFGKRDQAAATPAAPWIAPAPEKPKTRARPTSPTPDEALAWLMEGNAAFVAGADTYASYDAAEVAALAAGQAPLAVILGCSDSRAAAEILFQARLGDLFIVRVAGNTADALGVGSIDYAVHYLNSPLVVVLGHSKCGAVSAAVDMVVNHTHFESPVLDVLEPILPAVLLAQAEKPMDLVDASVRTHVVRVANRLKAAPSLQGALDTGKLKIVAAHYDLANGKVGLLS